MGRIMEQAIMFIQGGLQKSDRMKPSPSSISLCSPSTWRGRPVWPPRGTGATKDKGSQDSPPLPGIKFNGEPQQLGFFMCQVWIYKQESSPEIATEDGKVRYAIMALEGASAKCIVIIMTLQS